MARADVPVVKELSYARRSVSLRNVRQCRTEPSNDCWARPAWKFKCRMLFATGLLILITGSFYGYSQLNLRVVRQQQRERAQLLIANNLLTFHAKQVIDSKLAGDPQGEPNSPPEISFADDTEPAKVEVDETSEIGREINELANDLKPEESRDDKWKFIPIDFGEFDEGGLKPSDLAETDAYKAIIDGGKAFVHASK